MQAKTFLLLFLPCLLFIQTRAANTRVIISGQAILEGCHEVKACGTKPANLLGKRDVFASYINEGHWVSMKGEVILKGCYLVRTCKPLPTPAPDQTTTLLPTPVPKPTILPGSKEKPGTSCKAIKKQRQSAKSGVYHIKTLSTVTKVYCYMEDIPGCGGGGWTTVMKTDGKKKTFVFDSVFWKNKKAYHVTNGQSGVDNKETKLPTYWTMPFNSLCLGMKTAGQKQPKWIRLNYKASSLYSVIADGKYRRFSLGKSMWKSLIAGSSMQRNCNKEGFNPFAGTTYWQGVRIGIISNEQNDCNTPDSHVGFGGKGWKCTGYSTGNCACCSADKGDKNIAAYGYILAQ